MWSDVVLSHRNKAFKRRSLHIHGLSMEFPALNTSSPCHLVELFKRNGLAQALAYSSRNNFFLKKNWNFLRRATSYLTEDF
jgi:hypothetical protein